MLPIVNDNGARLAAILPTGLAALARGHEQDPFDTIERIYQRRQHSLDTASLDSLRSLPAIRSFVMVVVDGLGFANLQARAGHARTLTQLPGKRIQTVIPSTTGAALTTLTTGKLPGEHGLVGYQIRHPEAGLVSTLKGWSQIDDPHAWQRATPLFHTATHLGARAVAIGRPAHAVGGLTESILNGSEYIGGATIQDRFAIASRILRTHDATVAYVYIDELDKAAHAEGWESHAWLRRLEQLDSALGDFLHTLPADVGVVVTADHGIVDVPSHRQILLDNDSEIMRGVYDIGGEPRMRSLYLDDSDTASELAANLSTVLGKRAWVGTRDEAVAAGWYGETATDVAERLGDVIVAARGQFSFTLQNDPPAALAMIGQHGSLSEEERGVPILLGGVLSGSNFVSSLTQVAKSVYATD